MERLIHLPIFIHSPFVHGLPVRSQIKSHMLELHALGGLWKSNTPQACLCVCVCLSECVCLWACHYTMLPEELQRRSHALFSNTLHPMFHKPKGAMSWWVWWVWKSTTCSSSTCMACHAKPRQDKPGQAKSRQKKRRKYTCPLWQRARQQGHQASHTQPCFNATAFCQPSGQRCDHVEPHVLQSPSECRFRRCAGLQLRWLHANRCEGTCEIDRSAPCPTLRRSIFVGARRIRNVSDSLYSCDMHTGVMNSARGFRRVTSRCEAMTGISVCGRFCSNMSMCSSSYLWRTTLENKETGHVTSARKCIWDRPGFWKEKETTWWLTLEL